jgi:hypothetical protein
MRHLISLACLAAALGLYCVGLESGAAVAFVAGGFLEIVFWKRILSRRPLPAVR